MALIIELGIVFALALAVAAIVQWRRRRRTRTSLLVSAHYTLILGLVGMLGYFVVNVALDVFDLKPDPPRYTSQARLWTQASLFSAQAEERAQRRARSAETTNESDAAE